MQTQKKRELGNDTEHIDSREYVEKKIEGAQ